MHEAQPADQPPAAHALASPATATALGVLALVLLGITAALSVLTHQATFLNVATGIPIPLVYATGGVIVARRQPRNPVGWILILFVVLFLIPVDAGYYAALRYRLGYHGLPLGPAGIVLTSLWPLAFALFPPVDRGDLAVVRGSPGPQLAAGDRGTPPAAEVARLRGDHHPVRRPAGQRAQLGRRRRTGP